MAVNRQAGIQPVQVHPELYELIKIGKTHSFAPGSYLNIAIGPLIQTWRIGFKDAKVPAQEEITCLLEKTDPRQIELNDKEQTVFLKNKGMLIDLGALAKGYSADLIMDYLKNNNVQSALLNLGGNAVGFRKRDYWKIGIQNPMMARDNYVSVLKVADHSVVTSGIYERQLTKEGKTYHHILSPETGYPVTTDVASLSIYSKRSIEGEIWTTRLYGKSAKEIITELDQLEGIDGLVITKEDQQMVSKGLKEKLI
ncbi:FAD:protein FMN transferase [Alkalibacterium iburiense]|uniref:FAD:protein FMN transferase n=1 Tax=Alkalibacterium iburiense TaxID=290589 RepID=A0ABN0XQW6_9LACT